MSSVFVDGEDEDDDDDRDPLRRSHRWGRPYVDHELQEQQRQQRHRLTPKAREVKRRSLDPRSYRKPQKQRPEL